MGLLGFDEKAVWTNQGALTGSIIESVTTYLEDAPHHTASLLKIGEGSNIQTLGGSPFSFQPRAR